MGEQPEQKRPYDDITAVILAGGSSERYGQNKAFLEIGGIRLIDLVAEQMKNIFKRVILVANQTRDYEYLKIPIVEDLVKGLGPIGGIYTGLMSIADKAGFFIPCDMPFINRRLVRYMVDIRDNHAAVVPSVANEIEPLHAIYTRACLGPIRALLTPNVTRSGFFMTTYRLGMSRKMRSGNSARQAGLFSISTPSMNLPKLTPS